MWRLSDSPIKSTVLSEFSENADIHTSQQCIAELAFVVSRQQHQGLRARQISGRQATHPSHDIVIAVMGKSYHID
ncbi:hypothetical protein GJ744_006880 [Endocarpon pusillum]|uniref:Uncharacterized protein n=1 Tax=Endocarpon pusillum TaxID=364733 RepID=A0A8H7A3W7_9EURO|nr:hypothetical protein GJ744_006880 [Endocarpon pusillum]